LRGFKDQQAAELQSYAGTCQRSSQRLIVSEVVVRGWDIVTADISKAFLQGITYKELAEITGEPLREVNFDLPKWCYDILKKLPGFETFNPATEVLHCDKPGTGCTDAPRCFSIKVAQVTQGRCGMTPCSVDEELSTLHNSKGELVALMGNMLTTSS
jgi:hypothetical protein